MALGMNSKIKKAAVIGVYGTGPDFTTGQAVKCFELIQWLQGRYGEEEIEIVNSYGWKRRPISLFLAVIRAFMTCERVILLPAPHGVKVFIPMAYCLKKLIHRPVHYVVIGGWLADMLTVRPRLRRWVSSLDGVYVETLSMANALKRLGLPHVVHLPNFRRQGGGRNLLSPSYGHRKKQPARVCIYSRIVKEKGIEDGMEIIRLANEKMGGQVFELDLYGKVGAEFESAFVALTERNKGFVHYRGVKNVGEEEQVLPFCFALLFPSYYQGEGMPGTVLDAFAWGTPVIANDWKYIKEMIVHEENGLVYPFRDVKAAANELCRLYTDEELYGTLVRGCEASAQKYSADVVLGRFAEMAFDDKNGLKTRGLE